MLNLQHVSFAYDRQKVITDISFAVPQGTHVALIGESGCGKSTLLKLIYGLYDLTSGSIFHNKKPVLGPKFHLIPGMEAMKYLAQDFDLMPYISVEENIGKHLSNMYKDKKSARIQELLGMVEMTAYAKVKAKYLSGGQQQRVALAKVLALEPEILLLDEPFSQIDAFRRNNLRRNLFKYLKDRNISCIFATHDSTDILAFADEVVVMKNGSVVVKGNPKSIYEKPLDFYTASLFGDVNEIPSHLIGSEKDKSKTTFLYPHQIGVVANSNLPVEVVQSYFTGAAYLIEATSKNQNIFFENPESIPTKTKIFLAPKTNG